MATAPRPLTLSEVIPDVIKNLRNLSECVHNESLNSYQIGLFIRGILYSLEHPEKHFSDGSVVF